MVVDSQEGVESGKTRIVRWRGSFILERFDVPNHLQIEGRQIEWFGGCTYIPSGGKVEILAL